MRSRTAALFLSFAIAGCTAPPTTPVGNGDFVSAIGTPFYIAFKIPLCAATIALAGPVAGAAGLAGAPENAAAQGVRSNLDDGLMRNCGPPYVLAP